MANLQNASWNFTDPTQPKLNVVFTDSQIISRTINITMRNSSNAKIYPQLQLPLSLTNCTASYQPNTNGSLYSGVLTVKKNGGTSSTAILTFFVSPSFVYGTSYSATLSLEGSNTINISSTIYCLFEDSEVLTPSGYKSVKLLNEGDVVTTSTGKESKIKSIFTSIYPNDDPYYPIIIHANSIAENYPPKDCRLTKWHMIKYNDDWISPWKNEHVFKYDKSHDIIRYYHLQLEDFMTDHLVINGGLVVESKGNGSEEDGKEWCRRENESLILN